MSDSDCVQVAVRIRPLVQSEYDRGCKTIIEKTSKEPQIIINNYGKSNDMYTFNHVFSSEDQQDFIYTESVKKLLDKLFQGYNVTILAYGQTGSGKTHTMGTTFEGMFDDKEVGIIPRAMEDIFNEIEIIKNKNITVKCSFMELYQEQLYDLLSDGTREESIVDIREDHKGIVIPDLTEVVVISPLQTTNCLIRGSSLRAVGATAMNSQSSRSHAVFTITLEMRMLDEPNNLTTARFHLVDLAGSERSKKTKATGKRFREGVEINKGLLALGNVISALGSGNQGYISYRDSKLTRLLQDSLGGNSVTLMIACVSPADYNVEETLSTLRYADRARKIKNKPIINQDPQIAEINKLNQMIQKLRLELIDKGGNSKENTNSKMSSNEIIKWKLELNSVIEKNQILQSQLQVALDDVLNIEMRAVLAETANEELQTKLHDLKKSIIALNSSLNQETCPVEFVIHAKALEEIRLKIDDIDNILIKNKEDITTFNMSTNNLMDNSLGHDSINKTTEDEQIKLETLTTKQIGFSNELRNLNKELALKEELHQKFIGNLSNFCSYENEANPSDKIQEYENIIVGLEKERDELNDKLKHAKSNVTSAKIAEERRKKLELLEIKIAEFKKKNLHQEKLLKLREKDSLRINNLNKDIQEMKSCKVKLIRAMKVESDNFRLWKTNRDRELCQLKEKERKRQNEIVRMNCLHLKQQNVLKRKVEEALAASKRLKTVIDKQKNAQTHRKGNKNSSKIDNIDVWLGNEIDIILSVLEAKQSLEYIIEDRTLITQRINEIKSGTKTSSSSSSSTSSSFTDTTELETLEANLLIRNGQINDLHEKIIATNIDEKMKTICDNIHHIPDAQTSLKHIFHTLVEMKKEISMKTEKYETIENEYEKNKKLLKSLDKIKDDNNLLFMEELNSVQKKYEEKILILLTELNKTNEENSVTQKEMHLNIHKESLEKLEMFKKQLEILHNENNDLKLALNDIRKLKRVRNLRNKTPNYSNISSDLFSDFEEEDDQNKDPDWRNTPLQLRNSRSRLTFINQNATFNETIQPLKRKSDIIKCSCKGACSTNICTCKKNINICSEHCKCTNLCENKQNEEQENISGFLTPKKKRLSDNIMDVTTPSYPYAEKKNKQFYIY